MGWWFGRILTFEVIADAQPPSGSSILADASLGTIACQADQSIVGYAAYGSSIQAAVQPLVDCYGLHLFDDGSVVRSPVNAAPLPITADLLGNSTDGKQESPLKRDQLPARGMPASLRLSYYDPARDYQTGEARANASDEIGDEQQQELPAVLTAADAKSLSQQMLARAWAARDKLTLRLPPSFLDLEPGAELQLGIHPELWIVDTCTVDGFVVVVEGSPAWIPAVAIAAESGRIVANADSVETNLTLALLDVPDVLGQSAGRPTVLLAASSSGAGWKRHPVELSFGGQTIATAASHSKSSLGTAVNVLASADATLIDSISTVDVRLIDPDQWLTSCDDDALADGTNLAVLGSELLQFGAATRLAAGSWRLSRLLRGRAGTEWATDAHKAGETFCLIRDGDVRTIALPQWIIGSDVTANSDKGASATVTLAGESLRPPSPVNLSAELQQDGGMSINWTRRSRGGWAWTDQVDAPLAEGREQYNVTLTGSVGTLELIADQPSLNVPADQLALAGAGPATIEVSQVGDWALSKPAQLAITLS
ncbi:MAG TPA: phage tail protein [Sphingomicrobium sp.]|nr:phage tail protein [Sphingomicrobium sp.]